ncbi:Sporulation related domain-containing protein [Mariprofundus aestuarium]|uniref:Sporulation related domain-containing protein n=1 Tax=Mariprofundus aestuarium TaxID=1921086 RepID=A0A2K8L0F6_MARES|nr:SPOR domain-containing protein [Mariprofundus aestuarium]ATX80532.1 Sporulation related domain-containing protein [Mariprofundus aestuarium]
MARDFAKAQSPSRSDKKRESGGSLPVLGIVVIAGLCFATGFWVGGNQNSPAAGSVSRADLDSFRSELDKKNAATEVLQAKIEMLQEQVEQWKQKAGADAHTKVGDLKFYQELPKQSVMPAPVADSKPAEARAMDRSLEVAAPKQVSAHQPISDTKEKETAVVSYRIQVGSFKARADAVGLQSKLMKSGFSGFVHTVDLPDRGQWFRVYAGPYPDKEQARDGVRDILDRMKIRGLLVNDG